MDQYHLTNSDTDILRLVGGAITNATAQAEKPEAKVLIDDGKQKAAEGTRVFQAEKEMIESAERQLCAIGVEFEWISLHNALQFMQFSNLMHPYGGFRMLMESLQAAGIAALWLMIQFGLWTTAGLFFASALVISTSYGLWLNFRLDEYFRNLDSTQLAGMPSLAGSPQPLHDSVAGTDAGPGENYAMNAHPTSTEMGRGRGNCPLPQRPIPKNKTWSFTQKSGHTCFGRSATPEFIC